MFMKKLLEATTSQTEARSLQNRSQRSARGSLEVPSGTLGGPWGRLGRLLRAQRGSRGGLEAHLGAQGGPLGAPGLQNEAQSGSKWRPNWCLFADGDFSESGVLLKREHRFGGLGVVLGAKAARNFVTSFRFSLWGPCFAV